MANETYVVANEIGLYLIYYNQGDPSQSLFGVLCKDTIEYSTLQEADDTAAAIGGGTVGTTKPS
jgi:hypothetical protein